MVISKRGSRYSALIGISLQADSIEAVLLRRRNGSRLAVEKSIKAPFSLDLLRSDPELAGREIRQILTDAGIRERRCVVCVPTNWAFTRQIELPDLSGDDLDSYLALQAERAFAFDPQDLSMSVSHITTPSGQRKATLFAIPSKHMAVIQKAFKVAHLRPVSVTIGAASLIESGTDTTRGFALLSVEEPIIDLLVAAGGGIASMRTLQDSYDDNAKEGTFNVHAIVRQLRISLGQLPDDIRTSVRTLRLFGAADNVDSLAQDIENELESLGLRAERGVCPFHKQIEKQDLVKDLSPAVVEATARFLYGKPANLEFFVPQTKRLQQLAGHISSRRLLWIAGPAIAVLLLIGSAFVYQYWQLSNLETRWSAIEPKVAELETLQEKVKKFRLWFDDTIQSLEIASTVTEAFPEEGSVWVKTLEIKDLFNVYCSGFARTNRDWLSMRDRLSETPAVEALRVEQVRGDEPLQFSFSFRWSKGMPNES